MILLTPEGVLTPFENAYFYALLGEHIIGIQWDDNNTTVWNAGTTSAPLPDTGGFPDNYAEFDATGSMGWSFSANRLGIWYAGGVWALTFSDIEGDLTFEGDEFISFGDIGPFEVEQIVASDGRPLFEAHIQDNAEFVQRVVSVSSDGTFPIVQWSSFDVPENGGAVYDGVVVTPFPSDT